MKKLLLVPVFGLSLFGVAPMPVVAADDSVPLTDCELDWRFNSEAPKACGPERANAPSPPPVPVKGMSARRRIVMDTPPQESGASAPEQTAGVQVSASLPEAPPAAPAPPPPPSATLRLSGYTLEDVTFDSGSARLKRTAVASLTRIGEYLMRKNHIRLLIGGHTDEVGSAFENQVLSEERADAVRQFLIDLGVDGQRLTSKGFGESTLLPEFDGRDRRQRRVELLPQ